MATSIQGRSLAYRRTIAAIKESSLFNAGLVWSAFLATRLLLLFVQLVVLPTSGDCDIRIYARYANAYALASTRGGSVYDYCKPEYPHLALVTIAVPQNWISVPPVETDGPAPALPEYRSLFRIEMVAFDLLAFATVFWLVQTTFRHEPVWRRTKRLLLFVAGGLLLITLLNTRLDIALGALILLSLALLVSRWHYAWSFGVLAVAINFKLVPVVLIPVWVIASLPPALVANLRNRGGLRRLLVTCGWRTIVVVMLTIALSVPAYLSSGGRSLGFFTYHKDRGLEIGSVYSTALLLLKPFGCPAEFGFDYGSLNIDGPVAPLLATMAPFVTVALLAAATLLSCRFLLRRKYAEGEAAVASEAAPVGNPAEDLACCAALVIAAFMAGNKVFSPQYLLWLLPLMPLLSLPKLQRRLCTTAFVAACILSTATLFVWQHLVVGDDDWIDTVTRVPGPTPLGCALLMARNVAFLAFAVQVGYGMARNAQWQSRAENKLPLTPLPFSPAAHMSPWRTGTPSSTPAATAASSP